MKRLCRLSFSPGFTLVEIIVALLLLGIVAIFGGQLLTTAIQGYIQARSTDEVAQKAQVALQRMVIEFSYIAKGDSSTSGNANSFSYNAASLGQHTIQLDGTNILYTQDGSQYIMLDGIAANGLQFKYYDSFNSTVSTSFGQKTTVIGITLVMHGDSWPANLNKVFSTRTTLKGF